MPGTDHPGGHIAVHHGSGTDDGTLPYHHAGMHEGFRRHPGVVAYPDGPGAQGMLRPCIVVRSGAQMCALRYNGPPADMDEVLRIEDGTIADAGLITDHEVPGSPYPYAGIDMHTATHFRTEATQQPRTPTV